MSLAFTELSSSRSHAVPYNSGTLPRPMLSLALIAIILLLLPLGIRAATRRGTSRGLRWRGIQWEESNHADAVLASALVKQKSGDLMGAIADYDRAIALKRTATALNNRACALLASGDVARAVVDLQEAVSLEPEDATAHCTLAEALSGAGKQTSALESLKKATSLDPSWRTYARTAETLAGYARPRRGGVGLMRSRLTNATPRGAFVGPARATVDERTRTAYHEAGHAVLSAAINDTPHRVSIRPDRGTLGRTTQKVSVRPTSLAQIYLAGFAAEHLLTGRRPRQLGAEVELAVLARVDPDLGSVFGGKGSDGYGAVEQVLRTGVREVEEDIRREIERLYEVARESLSVVWPAVDAVASALLLLEELDHARLQGILGEWALFTAVRDAQDRDSVLGRTRCTLTRAPPPRPSSLRLVIVGLRSVDPASHAFAPAEPLRRA